VKQSPGSETGKVKKSRETILPVPKEHGERSLPTRWTGRYWEPFQARFPNRNRNRFVLVTLNVWPICDICDGHKLSQIRICDRIWFSVFFISFFSQTGLVTFLSQMSQMVTLSIVTGTNLFLFLFRLKRFGMNEIRKRYNRKWALFLFSVWNPARNGSEACALLNSGQAWAHSREDLGWIRVARTARQDARRSGKEDAKHTFVSSRMPLRILRGTQ